MTAEVLRFIIDCGIPSARGTSSTSGVDSLPRSARPGDWPWQASLLRSNIHACDGSLIHPSWLITTASCFQVIIWICKNKKKMKAINYKTLILFKIETVTEH